MKSVEHLLHGFRGYLELGMYSDANDELENLPTEIKTHPLVLSARLELLVEMERWEYGALLGESLSQLWPSELDFYFKTAYCLHELKRTEEAKGTIQAAPRSIRKTALYHYNLACYETQLGNLPEAKRLLTECFAIETRYREESLDDPDLQPIWASLGTV